MHSIRKSLLVAATIVLVPTFALAQAGAEPAKAPPAASQTVTTAKTTSTASAKLARPQANKLHHVAKAKKAKTVKLARTRKVASLDTSTDSVLVTPAAGQK